MKGNRSKPMSVDALVDGIVIGKRNFRRIVLPVGSDLSSYASVLDNYLREIQETAAYVPPDFRGSSLINLVAPRTTLFYNADLTSAYIGEAHLEGARLEGAHLAGAYLSGAYLSGAHLVGTDLSGAHLERASLTGANLTGATLEGVQLQGADLTRADLTRADLTGIMGLEKALGVRFAAFDRTLGLTAVQKQYVEGQRAGLRLFA